MNKFLVKSIIFILFVGMLSAQSINTEVISKWPKYSDAPNSLYHYLSSQSYEFLENRNKEVSKLQTKEDWIKRQKDVKETLMEIIGPFPEKTPLNAKITGKIERENYRIEKLIYESQPGFYVSAALFIPKKLKGKTPAVIYCSGHTNNGFRSPVYQKVIINLVKKGFIVLAYDPVGQGERLEYYDPVLKESSVGGPTLEHSYAGAQCFLIGSSEARYMIWDGIRAVDYLLSRDEVDPQRIGITGRSGGGTQSSYIAAMDERIKAAAPECYITNLKRLLESKGLQDAEQNFYHGILKGIDHADLLEVRAPKPTMIIATTRDFFSIQGVYETFNETKRAFTSFGKAENFSLSVDNDKHASTKKNRIALYQFFQKHLNLPGDSTDEEVAVLQEKDLYATKSGQVSLDFNGETVFSLNRKEYQKKHAKLKTKNILMAAKKISGYKRSDKEMDPIFLGSNNYKDLILDKYIIRGEGDYPIPFLLLRPDDNKKHPVAIYLNPSGKDSVFNGDLYVEWFASRGNIVLIPDLLSIGETGGGRFHGDSYNFKQGKANLNIWFNEIQIGRSLTAIQAGDISRLIDFLEQLESVDNKQIYGIAKNELCPALTHAASFDERILKIALLSPLISYKSLINHRYYRPQLMKTAIGGGLKYYDLRDLYKTMMPRKLLLLNVVNHLGETMKPEDVNIELSLVHDAYSSGNSEKMVSRQTNDNNEIYKLLTDWME